jgi:hypothetical protein
MDRAIERYKCYDSVCCFWREIEIDAKSKPNNGGVYGNVLRQPFKGARLIDAHLMRLTNKVSEKVQTASP